MAAARHRGERFPQSGCDVADDDVFVSDGTKSTREHPGYSEAAKNKIAISDPVYPVYVDTNVMAGHTGEAMKRGVRQIGYLPCKPSNGFIPAPRRSMWILFILLAQQPDRRGGHS